MVQDDKLFQLFNEIGIIEQLSRAQLEAVLPDGLKAPQFGVLNRFCRLGDNETPQSLASAFQVTKGAMTNTLNRLNVRGLVRIKPDPNDGRSKRVFITAKGKKVRNQSIEAAVGNFQEFKLNFTDEEVQQALPFLFKLRKFLDENR
jgi:DNA-binding MarR family transcriptional regulator